MNFVPFLERLNPKQKKALKLGMAKLRKNFSMQMKKKNNFEKRKGRLITVDGIQWKWLISARLGVVAYSETGLKKYAHASDVSGRDTSRGQYKRNSNGEITPKDIENWIRGLNYPWREKVIAYNSSSYDPVTNTIQPSQRDEDDNWFGEGF